MNTQKAIAIAAIWFAVAAVGFFDSGSAIAIAFFGMIATLGIAA